MTEEVWVLADDRPGNVGQCLGVAEALGLPFTIKTVRYGRTGGLPNAVRGASLLGVAAASRAALVPPWPRLAIGAGRRTAPVARWLKRRCGCLLVQMMDPGPPGRADFDLIAVAGHDTRAPDAPNFLRFTGAAHRVTPERLRLAAAAWGGRLGHLPRPRIAVIVGGATRSHPFTAGQAEDLGRLAAAMAGRAGGSLMVTTSRRTGADAEAALLAEIPEPRHVFRWGDAGDNPYFGYLGLADAIVVTGDSVSMVCEACAGEAPVYIYAPPGLVAPKHARLHRSLYAGGYARPLDGRLESWQHPPLNAAGLVAERIRQLLAARRSEP